MALTGTGPRRSLPGRLVGGAVGFRERLERLGPTYIKVGQFLALRPDLLSADYTDELMHLLDQAAPFPWPTARGVIEAELGCELGEVFAHVNPRPVAAGSFAQTHVARLRDGMEVAVKVRRPGIAERVEKDLSHARLFARLIESSGINMVISPRELLDELTHWFKQELDFRNEQRNLERLYELTAGSPYERVPQPFRELSGAEVNTSEYLRGIPISELMASLRVGTPVELQRVERLGIDRDRVAKSLLASVLRQIFVYEFFHADVHPGNLLALPDGKIGFVDFGLCSDIEPAVRDRQLNYLAAAYSGDVDLMFDALLEILEPGAHTDVHAFRRDFAAHTRRWISQIRADATTGPGQGAHSAADEELRESAVAEWLMGTMRAVRRHGLRLPSRLLAMYRALLVAETVAREMGSPAGIRSVGRNFFARLRIEEEIRALAPDRLQPAGTHLLALMRDGPRQLQRILSDLAEGRLALTISMDEVPGTARARRARTRLVATAILAVGLSTLLTLPALPSLLGVSLALPISLGVTVLYLSALLQWRRLT